MSDAASPTALVVWVEAARPRTLPAAVAPVLVGTAAAASLVWWRAMAALVVGLAVQVAVNFANDYFDGVKGVDTDDRLGPRRATAAGLVTPRGMKVAILVALGIAGAAGLALAAAVGWELLAVGVAAFAATLGYSGGPRPYASAGLGEVFVFVFFGLVATVGSQYVHDATIAPAAVWGGVAMGLFAVALLVVNNLRDIPTDEAVGKRTLSVRVGARASRQLFTACVVGALAAVALVAVLEGRAGPLLGLAPAPLAIQVCTLVWRAQDPPALVTVLGMTARTQLATAVMLAVGLALPW